MSKVISLSSIKLRDFAPEVRRLLSCIKTMNESDIANELEGVLECVGIEHYIKGQKDKREKKNA